MPCGGECVGRFVDRQTQQSVVHCARSTGRKNPDDFVTHDRGLNLSRVYTRYM